MKKILALVIAMVLVFACVSGALAEDKPYISVISKGSMHKFWQTVKAGVDDATAKYNVETYYQGPDSESAVQDQVTMFNSELAKEPKAICLASLDTEAVMEQLNTAKEKGIPVIGFDSGVPNAPEGVIVSTASTDNVAAGALAAQQMFDNADVQAALAAATTDAPVIIGVLSQEASSASITGRTQGFVDKFFELANAVKAGEVAVEGHDKFNKASESGNVSVKLQVGIPATTQATDVQSTAAGLLQLGLTGLFASNEGAANGVLAATTDGTDLDRTNGTYKSLVVIGFDAGKLQLDAVRNGSFYGAVTQDPYMIGFYAVELAVKAINGETLEPLVDTGCQFYNAANMDDAKIAPLLYD